MTDLLSIGAAGIRAYSRALGTVSDNIANAQTPGYARRSVRLEEAPTGSNSPLYRAGVQPGGVLVDGVVRAVDAWLVDDARISGSDAGRTAARLTWVDAAERALEDGTTGVGARLTGVFNAADALSADPASQPLRNGFLIAVDEAASALRSTAANLASVSSGIASDATASVNQFNSDLNALASVNSGLLRAREGSVNQASLLDERDRLVEGLAVNAAVSPSYGARGEVTLRLSGAGGETLLSSGTLSPLSLGIGANGQIGFTIGSSPIAPLSGKLAGLAEAAAQVSTRRGALDAVSNQFASDLNAAHQSGRDAAGNPGGALLVAGAGAATIAALALTPAAVAAASDTSANGNILALSARRGADGVEAGWANLVSLHAQSTTSARAQDAASTTRRDGAYAARDAVSAVDLDHEAAELLRFQQAYEGAARTIQVARETMQSILNIF